MIGSSAHESEILTQALALRNDPVGFVHWAYPWGVVGSPLADFKGPRRWQLEELERIGEHTRNAEFAIANDLPADIFRGAWSSGRGPGKSAFLGMLAHWHVSTRIGATNIVAANTESQLRTRTFPEFARWFGMAINSHWFVQETIRIVPSPWLLELVKKSREEGGLGIDPKYWYVQGQTWSEDNPDAFAGVHNPYGLMLQFDEASGIHSRVWEVAEGFFTETNPYRYWLAMSQMRNRQKRFFEIFNDTAAGEGWHKRTLSTRGMEGVDQTLVENQIKRYGEDSDFVRVEILGLPPQTSEDQFIPMGNVRAAEDNQLVPDYGEPLILGVDPAPRGKTSWRFRQGRNARDCVGRDTHGHWVGKDNVQIAEAILAFDQKYKPDHICIDFGMGTGVIDVLKRKKTCGRVHEVKFGDGPHGGKDTEWATHAIELWAKMREWLPGGMIEKTPEGKDDSGHLYLRGQLTDRGWRWSGREDNKKILETKEDLQSRGVKSPDDADALACTFEVNPPRREESRAGTVRIADGVGSSPFFD